MGLEIRNGREFVNITDLQAFADETEAARKYCL